MQLTMLGTGNALVTRCYNTCFVLTEGNDAAQRLLVDGGGGNGLLTQLERAGIPWQSLRQVFVTHKHMDHIVGILWLMRLICQGMAAGSYEGEASIYAHDEAIGILRNHARDLLQPKQFRFVDDRLHLVEVSDGEKRVLAGRPVEFFDIGSTKAKQFGFRMELLAAGVGSGASTDAGSAAGVGSGAGSAAGAGIPTRTGSPRYLVCGGDEPLSPACQPLAQDADWLLHEAFCLNAQADLFHPYEKHHSTALDACELAERLGVRNLVLYHTEDKNLADRRRLYIAEGRRVFSGNLFVPDDLETIDL